MGKRDAWRLGVIQSALAGKTTNREGAERLGMSRSQFKRLRRQVRDHGAAGVTHGNRGRISPRRISQEVRTRVVELLTGVVKLNDHHISDLLQGEAVTVSPASVRRLRQECKLPPKRRRRASKHRRRRERKARRGTMVLIDGSPFQWFDETGPRWTLLGAIDDATSEILTLTLRPTEDLHGYMSLMSELFLNHGVPVEMYGDRSGILIRNDDHWSLEEELAGQQAPTHFGRMLAALDVRFIAATSPQAKGRIERLWATLQDRLAAELRLLGHITLEAALAYLRHFITQHNARLACAAADLVSDFRPAPRDLDRILACIYQRVIARDNTVRVAGRWMQIPPGPGGRSFHKARVEVRELLDGRMLVLHAKHGLIAEQPAPAAGFTLTNRRGPRASRLNSQTDAPGSLLNDERRSTQPKPQAKTSSINRNKPKPGHPWKKPFVIPTSTRSI